MNLHFLYNPKRPVSVNVITILLMRKLTWRDEITLLHLQVFGGEKNGAGHRFPNFKFGSLFKQVNFKQHHLININCKFGLVELIYKTKDSV